MSMYLASHDLVSTNFLKLAEQLHEAVCIKMNPLLELKPTACLFIVGPQLSRNSTPHAAKLSYSSLIKAGQDYLHEFGGETAGRDTVREQEEPLKAMRTIVSQLRRIGLYDEWTRKTFLDRVEEEYVSIPDSVQYLLELHRKGALLACTQYDTILDIMAGHRPATISDQDGSFTDWLACGRKSEESSAGKEGARTCDEIAAAENTCRSGLLHLHGAQTAVDSICMLPYCVPQEGSRPRARDNSAWSYIADDSLAALRQVFHSKLVFLLGFDGDYEDPLLLSFLQLVFPEGDAKVLKNPPILLTSSLPAESRFLEPAKVLELRIPAADKLRDVILVGETKNFSVGMSLCTVYSGTSGHSKRVVSFLQRTTLIKPNFSAVVQRFHC